MLASLSAAPVRAPRRALAVLLAAVMVVATGGIRSASAVPGDTFSVSDATVVEANSLGTSQLTFKVTRAGLGVAATAATVVFTTSNGTATAGEDYTAKTEVVAFNAGETEKNVTVTVTGDTKDEDDETVIATLSSPSTGETLADAQGVGTIQDNDGPPSLSIADTDQAENASPAVFTVTLSAASGRTVTVDYTTTSGTATAGTDFTTTAGTLTFAPGTTSRTISVPLTNDTTDESNETFTVTLSNPDASRPAAEKATLADATATGTINDDDAAPVATVVAPAAKTEDATTMVFRIQLSQASGKEIKVDYTTSEGSADAGSDYTETSGTATIPAGTAFADISVPILEDSLAEPSETFTFTISKPTLTMDPSYGNVTIGSPSSGTGTINDDGDAGATISIGDKTVLEDNADDDTGNPSNLVAVTVTVTGTHGPVTVAYTTASGTATSGTDFAPRSGTLSFSSGETTKTVEVPVFADSLDEADEDFFVRLSSATGATLTDSEARIVLLNDDGVAPAITISNATVSEGAPNSSTPATFTVTLSKASSEPVTVNYVTAAGSATAGDDYLPASGTLVIPAGQTTGQITVQVRGDNISEPTETFDVNLSGATNASINDPQGVGTITDDDGTPTLSVDDPSTDEGDTSTSDLTFTVTLSNPKSQTVTVNYTTGGGSATAGGDYTTRTGTLTFVAGDTSEEVVVPVVGDTTDEPDETLILTLSTPSGATIADATGTGTIEDDDAPPVVTIGDDPEIEEGTAGEFLITLSAPSGKQVTVQYETVPGTATSPSDYTAVAPTPVTFNPGETSKRVTVQTTEDTTAESTETFTVRLLNASNATFPTAAPGTSESGTGTILDDDAAPRFSVADVTVSEGTGAPTTVTFTVRLLPASGQTTGVSYAFVSGSATAPADYTGTPGTLTFAAGETTKTVSATVVADGTDEVDETFNLVLSSPTGGAVIEDGTATATIDDDDGPSISINDVNVTEGNSGSTAATFTLTLSASSPQPVTVHYSTVSDTATAPADFTATSGDVTIPAGQTTASVTVNVVGETVDEDTERFFVDLSAPVDATVDDGRGVGTILSDDGPPALAVNDVSTIEGTGGTSTLRFTVSLTSASSRTVTVGYATGNETATAPGDYQSTSGQLTFAPGDTTENVDVPVVGDALEEAAETFVVTLSGAAGATIADGSGRGTITDDDGPASFSISDASGGEGGTLSFTVTRSGVVSRPASVGFSTANGTATAGQDYTATSGTLAFAIGQSSATVTVAVIGDSVDEPNETFSVVLSNATGATIADGNGVGTIADDDDPAPATTGGTGGGGSAAQGYSLVGEDGSLYAFGTAKNVGDMKGKALNAPIIGVAYTPGGNGYWLVAKDGGIFTFGDADFYGSMGDKKLNSPVIGMAATPTGKGYWLFAGDGGIFTFGDAEFFGSMGDKKLNAPVINMEPIASGNGYWLVAADGGIFTFGQAEFFGSMGDQKINQPVFDMTSTDTDDGYWLVARDGGIFSFGDAEPKFFGSAVNEVPRPTRVIGMDSTPGSLGYWIADASGKIYEYGNAQDLGDRYFSANPAPMIGFASVPGVKP